MPKCGICLEKIRCYQRSKKYYQCQHKLHKSCFKKQRLHNSDSFDGFESTDGSHYFCPLCRGIIKAKHFYHFIWDLDIDTFCQEYNFSQITDPYYFISPSAAMTLKNKISRDFLDLNFQDPEFIKHFKNCILHGHSLEIVIPEQSTIIGVVRGYQPLLIRCSDCYLLNAMSEGLEQIQ